MPCPNMRNEPNLPPHIHSTIYNLQSLGPISAPHPAQPAGRRSVPMHIGEPNLSPAPSPTRWPKVSPDAHRGTQFPRQLSSRASGCGAKRSSPKPRDLPKHHRRRRSQSTNYQQPTTNQECETNPIPPRRTCGGPKIRNEPNPSTGTACRAPICETNPICPTSTIPSTQLRETNPISPLPVIPSAGLRSEAQPPKVEGPVQTPSPTAIPNKQTLFAAKKRKTNPIRANTLPEGQSRCTSGNPIPHHQYTIHNIQYTIPCPNFHQGGLNAKGYMPNGGYYFSTWRGLA